MEQSVAFSGRFDPPHPGHIASIIRLEKEYGRVDVIILDHAERRHPVQYTVQILTELLEKYNVKIHSNRIHFGELNDKEWLLYNCDYYASGNMDVLLHMEKLGIKCVYVDRAYDYSASNYKKT